MHPRFAHPQPLPGGAGAAAGPAAVWVAAGPETRALQEGLGARKSALRRFLHPPKGSAEATDGSAWGRSKNLFIGASVLTKASLTAVGAVHMLTKKPACSIITLYSSDAIKASS